METIRNNSITIILSKEIYSIEAINKTKVDFKKICDIEIKNNSKNHTIIIHNKSQESIQTVKNEFCNYMLGIIKQNN